MFPLTPVDWQADAKCAELPIRRSDAMFFPERGGSSKAAREMCARCPVRPECLEYALENKEMHGIWGGTSEGERRKLRRGRKTEAA